MKTHRILLIIAIIFAANICHAEWEILEVRTTPFTRESYKGPTEMGMILKIQNTSDRSVLVWGQEFGSNHNFHLIESFIQSRTNAVWERQGGGMMCLTAGRIGWVEVKAGQVIQSGGTLFREKVGQQMILTFRRAYSRGDDKGSEILLGPFTIPEPKESDAAEPPIPGILGKPVGTELSVEGTFEGFDRNLLHVVKINGEKLSPAVIIQIGMPTGDLGPFARIPTNTVYKFNGKEMTYVVEALIDPKTGKDWQQAVSGRHFYFMVSEVLAPEGIKIRDQTKQTEANKETGPQPTNSHPVRP